ncbi:hypothetical protein PR002_g20073 [Phytophthora rubi]|uniref:Uncharacterized protein n=1 Tax=Phytophthora rubi TaxID=129364 RepID=A0A6A3JIM1_9STRA|nr:hypothetical protein PR002_g20073 [Phytophthora rubi]
MAHAPRLAKTPKAARRTLKKVDYSPTTTAKPRKRPKKRASIDEVESENQKARQARREAMRKRNANAQQLPRNKRRKKSKRDVDTADVENLETDKKAFYDTIDEPLFRVCGSCGELANSTIAVLKLYDPSSDFFSPLRNDDGQVEIIPEGLVASSSVQEAQSIWRWDRCYRSIQARKTPKFSRCSGFRI